MLQQGQPDEMSGQEKEHLSGEVMESLGVNASENVPVGENHQGHMDGDGNSGKELPAYIATRMGRQETKHRREMREMQARIADMQSRMGSPNGPHTEPPVNPYMNQGQPEADSEHERIARAVRYAREQDKLEEQKRHDAEKMAHVSRSYQKLQDNLDKGHDKYDDFHDVVMKDDVPFTPHIRDAVMLLGDDHQADVLYKLAKNPDELSRISKLHPLDQAKEVVKLSHALMGGNGGHESKPQPHRPLGQVKSSPVTSSAVTEKTTPAEIRSRMKAGKWK